MRCGGALREYWYPSAWSIRDAQAKARDLKREALACDVFLVL